MVIYQPILLMRQMNPLQGTKESHRLIAGIYLLALMILLVACSPKSQYKTSTLQQSSELRPTITPTENRSRTYEKDLKEVIWNVFVTLGLLGGISSTIRLFQIQSEQQEDNQDLRTDLSNRITQIERSQKNLDARITGLTTDMASHREQFLLINSALQQYSDRLHQTHQNISAQSDLIAEVQRSNQSAGWPSFQISQPAPDESSVSDSPQTVPQPLLESLPWEEVVNEYALAIQRNDRNQLRQMAAAELRITLESDDLLARGTLHNTRLQVVPGGGSYLLVHRGNSSWLVPTSQTLSSFATNQPIKGIFDYERSSLSAAELKQPAEVRDVDGEWEVVSKGIVIVPM